MSDHFLCNGSVEGIDKMNWKLVYSLSSIALFMGITSSLGLTQNIEWFLWLVVGLFSAFLIAKRTTDRYFLTGFVVGFLCGVLNSFTQGIFFSLFVENNPSATASLQELTPGISPRLFLFIAGPIIGLATGVIFGLLALLASKLDKKSMIQESSA